MKKVLFLCGKICSGKETYYLEHLENKWSRIIVSSVVRGLINSNDRTALQDTKKLDCLIADELIRKIRESSTDVVIDGIRQQTIIRAIEYVFSKTEVKFEYIWLDVSQGERKKRYINRKHIKDNISFEEADKGDVKLGIDELYSFLTSLRLKNTLIK